MKFGLRETVIWTENKGTRFEVVARYPGIGKYDIHEKGSRSRVRYCVEEKYLRRADMNKKATEGSRGGYLNVIKDNDVMLLKARVQQLLEANKAALKVRDDMVAENSTLRQSLSGKDATIERLQKVNAELSGSLHKARKVIDVLLFPNGY